MKFLRSRGFTLIELLVVIAIIALLASIILASLNTARSRSRDARRVADIKQIQLALGLFYNDNGYYPADIYASSSSLIPTYLASVPMDPLDGSNYAYVALGSGSCNPNATSYHLGAKLENDNLSPGSPLTEDADYTDTAGSACTGSCWVGNSDIPAENCGFTGTPPVYDARPQ